MTPKQIIDNFIQKQAPFESVAISEFGFIEEQVIEMMKEYAHFMCEKQKEICADNAEADWDYEGRIYSNDESGYCGITAYVLNQSIIQCKNATEI